MRTSVSRQCPDNIQSMATLPPRFIRPSSLSVIAHAPRLRPAHASGNRYVASRARGYGSGTGGQDILQPGKEPGASSLRGVRPQNVSQGDGDPWSEPGEAKRSGGKLRGANAGSRNSGVRQGQSYSNTGQRDSHRDFNSTQRSKGRHLRQVRRGWGRKGNGRRTQQQPDSGRRFVVDHQQSLWDMHGVSEVPSFDDDFEGFLAQHTDFSGDEVEVGGRHFDGPPASRSDRKGRAESSASARQTRGPARGFRSGQQQDDVWSPAGNQRRGRRNDNRRGGRNGQNGWQNSRNSQRGRGGRGKGWRGRGDGAGRWPNSRGGMDRGRGNGARDRGSADWTPARELSPEQVGWKSAMESYRLEGLRKRQDATYLKMIEALHPSPDRAAVESRLSMTHVDAFEASDSSIRSPKGEDLQTGRIDVPQSNVNANREDPSSWLDLDDDIGMYKADFARFMPDGDSTSLWDRSQSGGDGVPSLVDDSSDSWWLHDNGDANVSDTDGELDALLELLGGVDVIDETEAESRQLSAESRAPREDSSEKEQVDTNGDREKVATHASSGSTDLQEPLKVALNIDHPRGNAEATSDKDDAVRWAPAWGSSLMLQPQAENTDDVNQHVDGVGGITPPVVPRVKQPKIVVESETGDVSLDGDILMDWIQEFPN